MLAQLQRQYWLIHAASPDAFLRSALENAHPLSGSTDKLNWTPELIVVAQTFAGQYTEALLGALSQRWPSVPRVVVAGQWCDGEHRTGRPLQGVTRVAALAVAENWGSHWPWPVPASPAPDGASESKGCPTGLKGCSLVVSPDAELAAAVAQGLWAGGWLGIWAPWDSPLLIERPAVLIVDLPRGDELQAELLQGVTERYPGVPLVALGAFVRSVQRHRLMKLGAAEVLSRPVDLDDLLKSLDRCQVNPTFGPQGLA